MAANPSDLKYKKKLWCFSVRLPIAFAEEYKGEFLRKLEENNLTKAEFLRMAIADFVDKPERGEGADDEKI